MQAALRKMIIFINVRTLTQSKLPLTLNSYGLRFHVLT